MLGRLPGWWDCHGLSTGRILYFLLLLHLPFLPVHGWICWCRGCKHFSRKGEAPQVQSTCQCERTWEHLSENVSWRARERTDYGLKHTLIGRELKFYRRGGREKKTIWKNPKPNKLAKQLSEIWERASNLGSDLKYVLKLRLLCQLNSVAKGEQAHAFGSQREILINKLQWIVLPFLTNNAVGEDNEGVVLMRF